MVRWGSTVEPASGPRSSEAPSFNVVFCSAPEVGVKQVAGAGERAEVAVKTKGAEEPAEAEGGVTEVVVRPQWTRRVVSRLGKYPSRTVGWGSWLWCDGRAGGDGTGAVEGVVVGAGAEADARDTFRLARSNSSDAAEFAWVFGRAIYSQAIDSQAIDSQAIYSQATYSQEWEMVKRDAVSGWVGVKLDHLYIDHEHDRNWEPKANRRGRSQCNHRIC